MSSQSEKHEEFVKAAIEVARESRRKYGHAVGAVMVKEGVVVAKGLSINQNKHAEYNCISAAIEALGRENLAGCTLHSTQESCLMCFGAALYANVDELVFGAYASDLPPTNDYEYDDFSLERIAQGAKKFDGQAAKVTGGILRQDCAALMQDHKYWTVDKSG